MKPKRAEEIGDHAMGLFGSDCGLSGLSACPGSDCLKFEFAQLRSKNPPVSRATAIPVVRTAGERTADEAAGRGLLALTEIIWGRGCLALVTPIRLALVTLMVGVISGFLALGAPETAHSETAHCETAHRKGSPQLHPGGAQSTPAESSAAESSAAKSSAVKSDPAALPQSAVFFDTVPVELKGGTPGSLGVEFEVAEFEQEVEDSKGVAPDALLGEVPKFLRAADERFRRAVFAFVAPIGDFRELPRGPPSHA